MKPLESEVTATPTLPINTTIIDALFVLHLQTSSSLPSSFGAIAHTLLQKVMYAEGDVIHFVTDKWLTPSIKDWNQALKNNHFKESLIEFLSIPGRTIVLLPILRSILKNMDRGWNQ